MKKEEHTSPLRTTLAFAMSAALGYYMAGLELNKEKANDQKQSTAVEISDTLENKPDSVSMINHKEDLLVAEALKNARIYSKNENKAIIQNLFNNLSNHFIAVNYNGTLDFFIDCFSVEPGIFSQRYMNPGERKHHYDFSPPNAQGLIDKEEISVWFQDHALNGFGDVDEVSVAKDYLRESVYSYIFNQSPTLDSLAEGYYGRGLVALNEYAENKIFDHSGPAIKPLVELAKKEAMENNGAEKNEKIFGRRVKALEKEMMEEMRDWERDDHWSQGIMNIASRPDQKILPYNSKGATVGMFLTENGMEARYSDKDYTIIISDDKSNGYGDLDRISLETNNNIWTLNYPSKKTTDMARRLYYTAIRGVQDLCWTDLRIDGPEISEMKIQIQKEFPN